MRNSNFNNQPILSQFWGRIKSTFLTVAAAKAVSLSTLVFALLFLSTSQKSNAQNNSVVWTDMVLTTTCGATDIVKVTKNGWNGGAASANILGNNEDGWAEITVPQTNKKMRFGLSQSNPDIKTNSMGYVVELGSNGKMKVFEFGKSKTGSLPYSANDVIRIDRTAGLVTYLQNGVVFYTSAQPSCDAMLIDLVMNHRDGIVRDARASFLVPDDIFSDNLGNHTATTNVRLNGNWLSGDGNSEGIYVDAEGFVGAGTNAPLAKLHIRESYALIGGNPDTTFLVQRSNGLSTFTDFIITDNGNVGISTTTPLAKLQVNGDVIIGNSERLTDNGVGELGLSADFLPTVDNFRDLGDPSYRWDDVWATNGTIQTSDARDKENIQDIQYGLEEIMQLRPVSYEWINDPAGEKKIGLIAQEVLPIISEVVKTHDMETIDEFTGKQELVELNRMGMYYADLVPVLIKGIQEQQQMLMEKDAQIETLESSLSAVEETVVQMAGDFEQFELSLAQCCVSVSGDENSGTDGTETQRLAEQPKDLGSLGQNIPNPFNGTTLISYYLPKNTQSAMLKIFDMTGKEISHFDLMENGFGQVEFHDSHIPDGTYLYSLIIDGKLIDTKEMVLVR